SCFTGGHPAMPTSSCPCPGCGAAAVPASTRAPTILCGRCGLRFCPPATTIPAVGILVTPKSAKYPRGASAAKIEPEAQSRPWGSLLLVGFLGLLSIAVITGAVYTVVTHPAHGHEAVVDGPETPPLEEPFPGKPTPVNLPVGPQAPESGQQPKEAARPIDPLAGYVLPGKGEKREASLPQALRLPGEEVEPLR